MGFLSYGYKALKGSGQAINKVKPTVNKTKLEKKLSETTKAIQKAKEVLETLSDIPAFANILQKHKEVSVDLG